MRAASAVMAAGAHDGASSCHGLLELKLLGQPSAQLNGARLGAINTQLYSLMSTNAAGRGVRDVKKGRNSFHGVMGYKAVPSYDQATGWGTPDISTFAHALTGK